MKKNEECVFAVPCDVRFAVDSEKAKEFLELKPNLELRIKNEEIIKKLNIKTKTEPKEPVLRKIYKPNK